MAGGAGTFTGYKEPTGPGVRVDSCGYLGYAPPPQFDPMFAKLIGDSNSTRSFASALDRTLRALDEFHIARPADQSRPAARDPLASGRARRRRPHHPPGRTSRPGRRRTATRRPPRVSWRCSNSRPRRLRGGKSMPALAAASRDLGSPLPDGEEGVECPMAGAVVEIAVEPATTVSAGDDPDGRQRHEDGDRGHRALRRRRDRAASPAKSAPSSRPGRSSPPSRPRKSPTAPAAPRNYGADYLGADAGRGARAAGHRPSAASRPTRPTPAWCASAIAAS